MGKFLDSVRAKQNLLTLLVDDTGICRTCGNLCRIGETGLGCEAHDKLIIPDFPPYDLPNFKCKDWIEGEIDMSWSDEYPHSVFASALLSDGKLIAWKVGNPPKREWHDFYKCFAYSGKKMDHFTNMTVQVKEFVCKEKQDHNPAFDLANAWLIETFEPHPEHMGALPQIGGDS